MPTRTPTFTPRAASGPASAATSAAGPGVVDAAGEDQADLVGRDAPVDGVVDDGRGLLPEHEARPRADVPAALAPLEHEPARSRRAGIARAGPARGRAGRCAIPCALQPGGLVGPAPGDQGERRPDLGDRRELLGAQLGRDEPEDAHAPGPARPAGRPSGRSSARTSAPRSMARARNGKPAVARHGLGERGDVADARHRALDDRVARAQLDRHRRSLGQRPGRPRRGDPLVDRPLDGLDDPADRHELAGQPRGERGVLADRRALPLAPSRPRRRRPIPRPLRPPRRPAAAGPSRASRASRRPGPPAPTRASRPSSRCRPTARSARATPGRAATRGPAAARRRAPRRPPPRPRHPRPPAGPIPPRTQTGSSASASAAWSRTNELSAPHRPPASWPETIRPVAPDATARRTSPRDVASASTSRPESPATRTAASNPDPSSPPDSTGIHRTSRPTASRQLPQPSSTPRTDMRIPYDPPASRPRSVQHRPLTAEHAESR